MPARIYALAKELKIDSAELSDICSKAGISGKGSALASLSDEEVAKLKAYMAGGSGTSQSASNTTAEQLQGRLDGGSAIRREDYVAPAAAMEKPEVVKSEKPRETKKANQK